MGLIIVLHETDYKSSRRIRLVFKFFFILACREIKSIYIYAKNIPKGWKRTGETSSLFAFKSKILMTRFFCRGVGRVFAFDLEDFFFEFREEGEEGEKANDVRLFSLPLSLFLNSVCSEIKKFVQLSRRWNFYISSFFPSSSSASTLPLLYSTQSTRAISRQTNGFENDASPFLRSHARVLTRINILASYTFDIPGSALIDISVGVYTRVQAS